MSVWFPNFTLHEEQGSRHFVGEAEKDGEQLFFSRFWGDRAEFLRSQHGARMDTIISLKSFVPVLILLQLPGNIRSKIPEKLSRPAWSRSDEVSTLTTRQGLSGSLILYRNPEPEKWSCEH
ncbi:hypothetical protein OIU74_011846 [Salix koriyanagi]|uniref:Uncharacterized protein n=1 Tax=Salix koriyanagi TaxID=2511006 RepID=A0A9Q0TGE0_9ROSI|nr:hypothetical protein OIU74_011846 [Salix koriyanagi]